MSMPTTVAALLGNGDENRLNQAIEHGLARLNVAKTELASLSQCGDAFFHVVDQRVADALVSQLNTDIGDVVLNGWRKYRELVAAGERTRDAPGPPEDVELAAHEITYTQRIPIDVFVNGSLETTLVFELTVSIKLFGVIAVVGRGRLTALRVGDGLAGAYITLNGVALAQREVKYPVGVLVELGDEVTLVPGAPAPGSGPAPRSTASSAWWDRVPPEQPTQPYRWPKPGQPG
ncbi:MAG TPA: hypothetical protein VFO16_08580 [Pseudonocardiaceae bacterium]|nr:hypothetical protein [Pseudonocardiaceae bacterium]